jgi:hypothetical protein
MEKLAVKVRRCLVVVVGWTLLDNRILIGSKSGPISSELPSAYFHPDMTTAPKSVFPSVRRELKRRFVA